MEGGFRLYSKPAGVTDDRIHAGTDVRPIARCLRYGRPAPINSDANPAAKRPNAIHFGCIGTSLEGPLTLMMSRLRCILARGNEIVSQRKWSTGAS
jgi:hypothetical protein